MSFDIKKYCHIGDVLQQTGNSKITYNHAGLNVFYVEKGKCTANCHGMILEVKREEILCCEGNVVLTPSDNCKITGFNINGIIADKYAKEIETAFITSSIFAPFLPQQILQVAESYDNLSEIYISNISFEIINTLSHGEKKAVIGSQVIISAVKLIKENYSGIYGVEELRSALQISKSHLVREFFKHTGTTPGKYLISVRIDAVKHLLTQTSMPLSDIAEKTGFSGDNYLCKSFKKATGETPMAYRARIVSSQYLPNQLTLQVDPDLYIVSEEE